MVVRWYPTTMGSPTKNDHFGVFWGYHHLRKHPHSCPKNPGPGSNPIRKAYRNVKGNFEIFGHTERFLGLVLLGTADDD